MSFDLDQATDTQLLTIKGVGAASVPRLRQHLTNHGTFKSWVEFLGCAPQADFKALQEMHVEGRISSNMTEFKDAKKGLEEKKVEGAEGLTEKALEIEPTELGSDYAKSFFEFTSKICDLVKFYQNEMNINSQRNANAHTKIAEDIKKISERLSTVEIMQRTSKATEDYLSRSGGPPGFGLSSLATPMATGGAGAIPKVPGGGVGDKKNTRDEKKTPREEGAQGAASKSEHAQLLRTPIDPFEGKLGEWDNWFHKFNCMAETCNWSDQERVFKMTSALKGNALTVHRNLPVETTKNYQLLCSALQERYGKTDRATKAVIRADLATISQKEDEELEVFADRVYSLTIDAYPENTPVSQLQLYAVEFFMSGCKEKNLAWLVYTTKSPSTITEAVNYMKMALAGNRRLGMKYSTRKVAFENDIAIRQIVGGGSEEIECHGCGGKGHVVRECPSVRKRRTSDERCPDCGDRYCNGACRRRYRSPSPRKYNSYDRRRDNRDRYRNSRGCRICGDWRHDEEDCPRRHDRSPSRSPSPRGYNRDRRSTKSSRHQRDESPAYRESDSSRKSKDRKSEDRKKDGKRYSGSKRSSGVSERSKEKSSKEVRERQLSTEGSSEGLTASGEESDQHLN